MCCMLTNETHDIKSLWGPGVLRDQQLEKKQVCVHRMPEPPEHTVGVLTSLLLQRETEAQGVLSVAQLLC